MRQLTFRSGLCVHAYLPHIETNTENLKEMKALIKKRRIVVLGGVSRLKKAGLESIIADDYAGRAAGDEWDMDDVANEMANTAYRFDLDASTTRPTDLNAAALEGYTMEELLRGLEEESSAENGMAWTQ